MATIPTFTVLGLDHVVIRATDVDKMVAFYRDVLGCPVEKVQDEFALTQLRAGTALIDIVDVTGKIGRQGGAAPGKEARNMDHFCLSIRPWDEAALLEHLKAHGVTPGEIGRRYGAEGFGQSIYLRDPEGNGVELKGPGEGPERAP
jgi:catechol 2,3-dioxygenase-like lactoylglutathione lyase family enzyme